MPRRQHTLETSYCFLNSKRFVCKGILYSLSGNLGRIDLQFTIENSATNTAIFVTKKRIMLSGLGSKLYRTQA